MQLKRWEAAGAGTNSISISAFFEQLHALLSVSVIVY